MKNKNIVTIEKNDLLGINGGFFNLPPWELMPISKWFLDGWARFTMRRSYDDAYKEADFMVYKM